MQRIAYQDVPTRDVLDTGSMILDMLPAAICVCDQNGRILHCNERAARLCGRAPNVGDPTERFCGWNGICRTDGRACGESYLLVLSGALRQAFGPLGEHARFPLELVHDRSGANG